MTVYGRSLGKKVLDDLTIRLTDQDRRNIDESESDHRNQTRTIVDNNDGRCTGDLCIRNLIDEVTISPINQRDFAGKTSGSITGTSFK